MENKRLRLNIMGMAVLTVLLAFMCSALVYAAEDEVTSGSGFETTTEGDITEETTKNGGDMPEGTTVEFTTEATTVNTTVEQRTETTTSQRETQTTEKPKPTEATTKAAETATTQKEPSTETTTKAVTDSAPGTGTASGRGGGGSGKSSGCRVTFQSGEGGAINRSGEKTVSVSIVINKGTAPKETPEVIPKTGTVFVGWSKNGVTLTDPKTTPLYTNTVYTAVYRDKNGLGKLLDIGGLLDKLRISHK